MRERPGIDERVHRPRVVALGLFEQIDLIGVHRQHDVGGQRRQPIEGVAIIGDDAGIGAIADQAIARHGHAAREYDVQSPPTLDYRDRPGRAARRMSRCQHRGQRDGPDADLFAIADNPVDRNRRKAGVAVRIVGFVSATAQRGGIAGRGDELGATPSAQFGERSGMVEMRVRIEDPFDLARLHPDRREVALDQTGALREWAADEDRSRARDDRIDAQPLGPDIPDRPGNVERRCRSRPGGWVLRNRRACPEDQRGEAGKRARDHSAASIPGVSTCGNTRGSAAPGA